MVTTRETHYTPITVSSTIELDTISPPAVDIQPLDVDNQNATENERLVSYEDALRQMRTTAVQNALLDYYDNPSATMENASDHDKQVDTIVAARETLRATLRARSMSSDIHPLSSSSQPEHTPSDQDIVDAASLVATLEAETPRDLELQTLLGEAALQTTNPQLLQHAHDALPTPEHADEHPETAELRAKIELAQGVVQSDDPARVVEIADQRAYQRAMRRHAKMIAGHPSETTRLVRGAFSQAG